MNINFKKLNKKQVIIIIVVAVLLLILIPTAIYCGVNKESPKQMVGDIFTSNQVQLVGKWQGDKDLTAYEFKEDGSYDSYISSFSYSANYFADSSKLTLTNPATAGSSVVYKYSVHGDNLTLTLVEENGKEVDEKETFKYRRVENIRSQDFVDFLKEYADAHGETQTKD
ncbi:MAG: hypothetical protein IJR70_08425 [Eubacterium sp.]|nr:hypothetical protein [Eubacterium sp.]